MMMINRHLAVICVSLTIILSLQAAMAQTRASMNKIQGLRIQNKLSILLEKPSENLSKIRGLYIRPDFDGIGLVTGVLEEALDTCHDAEDKTALHLLLAATAKANKISKHMPPRHGGKNDKLQLSVEKLEQIITGDMGKTEDDGGVDLLHKLIMDFKALPEAPRNKRIRGYLIKAINTCLLELRSEDIPCEIKTIIINDYLKSKTNPLDLCDAAKIATIYETLGIKRDLISLFNKYSQDTEDIKKLSKAMKIAAGADWEARALEIANELLEKIDMSSEYDMILSNILDVYVQFHPDTAVQKFRDIRDEKPLMALKLYKASCAIDQFGDKEKRYKEWLDFRIMKKANHSNSNFHDVLEYLDTIYSIAHQLEAEGDLGAAVFMAESIVKKHEDVKEKAYWNIVYLLGRCYMQTGRLDEGTKLLKKCIEARILGKDILQSIEEKINKEKR